MSGVRQLVYWDSCIFIAWLTGEAKYPENLAGIAHYRSLHQTGEITIVTSTVSRVEVLDSKLRPDKAEVFKQFLNRTDVSLVDVRARISDLAHDVRNYYANLADDR